MAEMMVARPVAIDDISGPLAGGANRRLPVDTREDVRGKGALVAGITRARSRQLSLNADTPEAITQREWNRTRSQAIPLINKLAEPTTEIVDAADKEGAALYGRTQQQINQVNGRRIGTMSAAQRRHINNVLAAGSTATAATNSTAARLAQRDFDNEKAVTGYNYANAITNQGLATLTQGSNMKIQREAQNKANSKGFMSSMLGMVGTVAGGMMGGPVGAAIGGTIGGAIGG